MANAATAVLSDESTSRRLVAANAAAECARLHHPHEPWALVHQRLSCGARTTNKASEQLFGAPRSAHAQEGGVRLLSGGSHMLARAVQMRLPSASSAPLKRALSAAPAAHPALDSPPCARDAARQLGCSSSANSLSETGFVVTSSAPAPRSLRSPIPTDGSSDDLRVDGLQI